MLLTPPGLTHTASLIVYYIILGLVSYALGIALDKVSTDSCDRIVSLFTRRRFPYNEDFAGLRSATTARLTELLGRQYTELPSFRPFSTCKRLIRATSPSLWAESEQLEARVRALGAVWAAAAFSMVMAIVVMVRGQTPWAVWLVASVVFVAAVGHAFWHARRREVENTYMNLLLATSTKSLGASTETKA